MTFSGTSLALPGQRALTCTYNGQTISLSNALTVYDASPQINTNPNGVQQLSPDSSGGFYVTIYGTNFGKAVGVVSVCRAGTSSCGDFAVSYSGGYATWGDTQINLYLAPNLAAGGNYNVQVTSVGEAGNGFVTEDQDSHRKAIWWRFRTQLLR